MMLELKKFLRAVVALESDVIESFYDQALCIGGLQPEQEGHSHLVEIP
jgi:hypothetical protein